MTFLCPVTEECDTGPQQAVHFILKYSVQLQRAVIFICKVKTENDRWYLDFNCVTKCLIIISQAEF